MTSRSIKEPGVGRVSDARSRLIHSAIELMHARSYTDVGVQELCDHAGVKKGSFYHFFPSKQALALAALDQACKEVRQNLLERAFSKDLPPLQRIERYFDLAYSYQRSLKEATGQMRGCPFGNLAVEMSTQDEAIREKVHQIFQEAVTYIERALIEAQDEGQISGIDSRLAAEAILAQLEGGILLAKLKNDPEIIRQVGQTAFQWSGGGKVGAA